MTILEMTDTSLETGGAIWTGREIAQQPEMLRETQKLLQQNARAIEAFLTPLLGRPDLRIVLAGAGTSAFIGESLAPFLAGPLNYRIEAVPTTDIVSAPRLYLDPDRPTLLVSFGRSGSSPESLAAIELADRAVKKLWHLVITCNPDGHLARYAAGRPEAMLVLLPEPTHDRSFAMTSSFTCMLRAATACLLGIEKTGAHIDKIATATEAVIDRYATPMRALAKRRFDRLIYLGAAGFKGIAHEAALKMTEMTNGRTIALHETTLGVRHGPKVTIDNSTLVVLFLSNDSYSRQYDMDLLAELLAQQSYGELIVVSAQPVDALAPSRQVLVPGLAEVADYDLLVPFIAAPQMLAMFQSLEMGCTPDDPNPAGLVSRIVRGVAIHAFD